MDGLVSNPLLDPMRPRTDSRFPMQLCAIHKHLDRSRRHQLALALMILILGQLHGYAHPPISTLVTIVIASDGRVTVAIDHDPFAFAIGVESEQVTDDQVLAVWSHSEAFLSELLENAPQRWQRELTLRGADQPIAWRILKRPEMADFHSWKQSEDGFALPGAMQLLIEGHIPSGVKTFSIRLPAVLDQTLLVVERPGLQRSILPLDPGDESPPLDVSMLRIIPGQDTGQAVQTDIEVLSLPSSTILTSAWRFMRLGFLHIVPFGIDHGLFVLGLFLMSPSWKSLLGQVSVFTAAHTLTMALASFSIVAVPAWVIEPLIALSIVFVAIENIACQTPTHLRLGVCFVFGLVHGLGFAGGLAEYGLRSNEIVASLVAFTAGIEAGHFAVLCLAYAILGWLKKYSWYRSWVAIPLSLVIGIAGLYWSCASMVGW